VAILGISCFYHDSAACIIVDGKIVAAAQEERFTRKKHDARFPSQAISFCLSFANISPVDIEAIVFYDKPFDTFERIIETILHSWPFGISFFVSALPTWIKEKIFTKQVIKRELYKLGFKTKTNIKFSTHHFSHAASSFYPSGFESAAIVVLDGVGEWASISIYDADANGITLKKELRYPHSLGLLYSAFTLFCGFKVNSGEYKLMGLAPYGMIDSDQTQDYIKKIKSELVQIFEDGSICLNMNYFKYNTHMTMVHQRKWKTLFNLERRKAESEITQEYMNLALAIQTVLEEIVLKIAKHAKFITGKNNLCLAGGVALNCVANAKILEAKFFEKVWIQPAAGDAGGAMGAALAYDNLNHSGKNAPERFTPFLGPSFDQEEISNCLNTYQLKFEQFANEELLASECARLLDEQKIIGWFQGRMEWGPRALGHRSILADARRFEMKEHLNIKIKLRENFRPFAPIVLEEEAKFYFQDDYHCPFMMFTNKLKKEREVNSKSPFPAVTHLDGTSRLQSVTAESDPLMFKLLSEFKKKSGIGLLINTSFNVRGEPIVCSPDDAVRCFLSNDMDVLVLGNVLIRRDNQDPENLKVESRPLLLD